MMNSGARIHGFSDLNPAWGFECRSNFIEGATMAEVMRQVVTRLAAPAMLLLGLVLVVSARAEPGNDNRAPDLGDYQNLRAPAGNKVAYRAYAEGVQVWRWNGTSWQFLQPEAILYDAEGDVVGTHFSGPTWESLSGSYVVATVLDRATVNADAIPWLLLKTVESDGPGIFRRVTYIQRVNTVGGNPPGEPGAFPGEIVRVPYIADYFFYRQHN
jgi:hypothetical protein